MTDFRTTKKFGSGSSASDGYDVYLDRQDNVDNLTAADVNSLANSIAETQKALVDGYAIEKLQPAAFAMSADNEAMVYDTATQKMIKKVMATSSEVSAKANSSTTISTSAPLTGGGDLSTNRTLSMPAATISVDGYLASADFTTFNNKLTSPLTTKGDLLTRDGSTHVRLPVGADGYVLTADSTQASGLKFAAVSGGGSSSFTEVTLSTPVIDVSAGDIFHYSAGPRDLNEFSYTNITNKKIMLHLYSDIPASIVLPSSDSNSSYRRTLPKLTRTTYEIVFWNSAVSTITMIEEKDLFSQKYPVANGDIRSMAVYGDDLYIAGQFTLVDTKEYYGAASLSTRNGEMNNYIARFNGTVNCIVIDERGNAFFGGSFTAYGDQLVGNIAKINLSTGALDTAFQAGAGVGFTGGQVRCMSYDPFTDSLYVGGGFSNYNNAVAVRGAKLIGSSGVMSTAVTGSGFGNEVFSIALDPSGGFVYWGGSFTTFQGVPKNRIVRTTTANINAASGTLGDTGFTSGVVNCLAVDYNNSVLYAGGSFTQYSATTCQRVAKINTSTNAYDGTFSSVSGFDSTVLSISLDQNGSNLYCGGQFTTYGGTARQRVAKLNASTGALVAAFNSASGFNTDVNAVIANGDDVYCFGNFATYGASSRNKIAKLNSTTAVVDATFVPVGFPSAVLCGALDRGSLYCGGGFTISSEGVARKCIAKYKLSTMTLDTTFDPGVSIDTTLITDIKLNPAGTALYFVGSFTTYQGTARQRIAKISTTNAALDMTFDSASGFTSSPNCLILNAAGTSVYVGHGTFAQYKTVDRNLVTKLNASTAAIDLTFDTTAAASGGLGALALALDTAETSLYCAGAFTQWSGGTARNNLAKVSASTAALDGGFVPAAIAGGGTNYRSLALDSSGNIYASGHFTTFNSISRKGLVKLSTSTGAHDATFNFSTIGFPNAPIYSIVLNPSQTSLYCAGNFNALNIWRGPSSLMQVSTTTGEMSAFNPSTPLAVPSSGYNVYKMIYDSSTDQLIYPLANRITKLKASGTRVFK